MIDLYNEQDEASHYGLTVEEPPCPLPPDGLLAMQQINTTAESSSFGGDSNLIVLQLALRFFCPFTTQLIFLFLFFG